MIFLKVVYAEYHETMNMQAKDDIAIDKKVIVKEWYI